MANRGQIKDSVANGIAITITAVWAASFLADIVLKGWDPNPLVHVLMLFLAGAIYGHGYLRNGRNGNGNGKV